MYGLWYDGPVMNKLTAYLTLIVGGVTTSLLAYLVPEVPAFFGVPADYHMLFVAGVCLLFLLFLAVLIFREKKEPVAEQGQTSVKTIKTEITVKDNAVVKDNIFNNEIK